MFPYNNNTGSNGSHDNDPFYYNYSNISSRALALNPLNSSDDLSAYATFRTSVWLWKIVPLLILVLGTAGNVLCLVVFRSKYFKGIPVTFAMSALAVVDTGVLYTGLLRFWLFYVYDESFDIRNLTGSAGCKIHVTLTYFLQYLSSWTLVLIAVERTIAIAAPLNARVISTKKSIRIAWLVLVILLLILTAHFFFTFTYDYAEYDFQKYSWICFVKPEFKFFYSEVWHWIDFLTISVLPSFLIFAGNFIIIACIGRAIKMRKGMISESNFKSSSQRGEQRLMTSYTWMMFGVSLFFLCTTLPTSVCLLLSEQWYSSITTRAGQAWFHLGFAICFLLYYLNNTINFALYCITAQKFRKVVTEIFHCVPSQKIASDGTKTFLTTTNQKQLGRLRNK